MKRANQEIREYAAKNNVYLWEIALAMGISGKMAFLWKSPVVLSRWRSDPTWENGSFEEIPRSPAPVAL